MPVGIDREALRDPQDADPWDADVDDRLGSGGAASGTGREATRSTQGTTVFEVNTNEMVFDAPPGYGNVLEGVVIAYAPERREIYGAGSLTEDVGLVDLAAGEVARSWSLGSEEQDWVKKVRYGNDVVWTIHVDGDELFASTLPSGKTYSTFETGSFAELCFREFFEEHRLVAGVPRPVQLATAIPENGDLFLILAYDDLVESPDAFTAASSYQISARRLVHLRFEPIIDRIRLLGDFEAAAVHHVQQGWLDYLRENWPQLEELVEPQMPATSVESVVDMIWIDPFFDEEGIRRGALLLLVREKEVSTSEILGQKLVIHQYEDDSALCQVGVETELPPAGEIGVASALAWNEQGILHVATNPSEIDYDASEGVWKEGIAPGHLLGYRPNASWFLEVYRSRLAPLSDVEALACNSRTGRVGALYKRNHRPLRVTPGLYEEVRSHDYPVPPYLSRVDVYEADEASRTATHLASAQAGIQSKVIVAIDGEDDYEDHEFAVGSAGGDVVVFVPNLDGVVKSAQVGSLDVGDAVVNLDVQWNPQAQAAIDVLAPVEILGNGLDEAQDNYSDTGLQLARRASARDVPILACDEIQLGTAPYMMLFSNRYEDRLLVLNRLGGNQILMMEIPVDGRFRPDVLNPVLELVLGPTLFDSFHGPEQVGYWPSGMTQSESGDHVYVLSHFDRSFRILNAAAMRSASQNNDPAVLTGVMRLPRQDRILEPATTVSNAIADGDLVAPESLEHTEIPNPEYQYVDVLSELTSTPDGMYQFALLSEVGEFHLLRTDEGQAEVVASGSILPVEESSRRGPGRMQGVFEHWGQLAVTLWVYVPHYPDLDAMYQNAQAGTNLQEDYKALVRIQVHRIVASPVYQTTVFNLDAAYSESQGDDLKIQDTDALRRFINPRRLVFFSQNTDELFVGETVWRYDDTQQTVVFQRQVEAHDETTVAHRIVGEDATGLFGEYYADAADDDHLLRKLVLSGDGYQIVDEYSLDEYYQMKPSIDIRESMMNLETASSQPTRALVHIKSFVTR